ncbi:MAG TPA: polysaccharide deacetylase family protein [Candidatus Eremiobacteraceae bacterium]|nr:polysaccharide deacetylase family protein [Candidatus Eremiobacteraceae bacterium]
MSQLSDTIKGFFVRHWRVFAISLGGLVVIVTLLWYVTESPKNQLWGPTVTSEPVHTKVVALTFDDGPNPPYTDRIIDYLHTEHVPATFFVVGLAVQAHPDVVRRELADGNAIGNHTWDHAHLVLLSRTHIERELTTTEDEIQKVTGEHTQLFRPPFGARDFRVISVAHQMGLQVIMWSVPLPADWTQPPPRVIADRVLKYVKDGSIIVLHDGNKGRSADRSNTVEATKIIVSELRKKGYRFVTVPELEKLGYAEAAAATPPPGPTEYGPFFTPRL